MSDSSRVHRRQIQRCNESTNIQHLLTIVNYRAVAFPHTWTEPDRYGRSVTVDLPFPFDAAAHAKHDHVRQAANSSAGWFVHKVWRPQRELHLLPRAGRVERRAA
jgi:hypothetical protein